MGELTTFDLQAHRGGSGLAPENTLEAFGTSLDVGVTTLECDVHVSSDGVPVLSHERTWAGRIIPLHTVEGLGPITTLRELVDLVRERRALDVRLNVETKFDVVHPDEDAPRERFVESVLGVLRATDMLERCSIQSFDWAVLRMVREEESGIRLNALANTTILELHHPGASPWLAGVDIDDFFGSVPAAVSSLGFDCLSPSHTILTPAMVAEAHEAGLTVLPWTVDAAETARRLVALGVDGIITGRPDVVRTVLEELGLPLPRRYPRID
jgi:glycerophosphoryl diester phosphodiesterase